MNDIVAMTVVSASLRFSIFSFSSSAMFGNPVAVLRPLCAVAFSWCYKHKYKFKLSFHFLTEFKLVGAQYIQYLSKSSPYP